MRIFRKSLVPAILLLVVVVALIAGGPSNRLDQEVIRALAATRADSPGLTHAAIILTHAGSAYGTIGLGLVAALALWLTGAGRRAVLIAALLASLAIGATRPYLGVHWPSDVIGGWALGLIAVWIVLRVGERSGVLAFEPQHDVVGGHRAAIDENEAA